jgi:hypothetical protein
LTRTRSLGLVVLAFYAAHVAWHVARGTTGDLLWACNVAVPMLAVGCFSAPHRAAAFLCASAVMWLAYGAPMWVLDVSTGGDFVPTSILTHFGGLAVGVVVVRRLGWPRGAWLFACAGTATLVGVTRLFGSPERNANLAFRVHDGWEARVESTFGSHAPYLVTMWLASALVFFVIERVAIRIRMAA